MLFQGGPGFQRLHQPPWGNNCRSQRPAPPRKAIRETVPERQPGVQRQPQGGLQDVPRLDHEALL